MKKIEQHVEDCLSCPCRVDGGVVEDYCSQTRRIISYEEGEVAEDCPLEDA